jgi:hypothetical protein
VVTAGPTYLEVVMRMLLKAVFDTEASNEVSRSGGATQATDQMVEALQPEAFYAFGEDGQRAIVVVFDLADPSQLPVVTDPLFLLGKAKVTVTPCMNLEDLKKGLEESTANMQAMQGQSDESLGHS